MEARVKHVVVDAGGFIRNAPLKDIGDNIYTVHDVVCEIRDKATRDRLQVLPYELKFREPTPEAIKLVTNFSKKTGDYASLSAVDIRVLALVYQLEKENIGTDHIKTEPDRKITWETSRRHLENPTEIAGFYLGKKKHTQSSTSSRTTSESSHSEISQQLQDVKLESQTTSNDVLLDSVTEKHDTEVSEKQEKQVFDKIPESNKDPEKIIANTEDSGPTQVTVVDSTSNPNSEDRTDISHESTPSDIPEKQEEEKDLNHEVGESSTELTNKDDQKRGLIEEGASIPPESLQEEDEDEEEEEEEESCEEEDEDGGWITPGNIQQMKASMGDVNIEPACVEVACVTTDFAMQNVLIQMGLNVISVDGMLIKRAKSYVLRCFACFKVTMNMTKQFCYHCGNNTLQKVSMTVDEDGSIRYFLSKRKPTTTRGLRYSLPKPQGGKYATNPVLCEDQQFSHQRSSKAGKVKYDVFDPDYMANTSPFAPTDIHSRAAQLGMKGKGNRFRAKRNPNENNKVYGRRK